MITSIFSQLAQPKRTQQVTLILPATERFSRQLEITLGQHTDMVIVGLYHSERLQSLGNVYSHLSECFLLSSNDHTFLVLGRDPRVSLSVSPAEADKIRLTFQPHGLGILEPQS